MKDLIKQLQALDKYDHSFKLNMAMLDVQAKVISEPKKLSDGSYEYKVKVKK